MRAEALATLERLCMHMLARAAQATPLARSHPALAPLAMVVAEETAATQRVRVCEAPLVVHQARLGNVLQLSANHHPPPATPLGGCAIYGRRVVEQVVPAKALALPQRLGVGMLARGRHMAAPAIVRRALALPLRLLMRVEHRLPRVPSCSEIVLRLATLALRRSPIDRAPWLRDIGLRRVRPTAEEVEVELDAKAG